jgi:ribosomal protein S18 acetylase RimI-like enzyme
LGIGLIESYRNQGIGEQLLRAAITQAQQHDFKRIELTVFSTNQRTYKFYENWVLWKKALSVAQFF